jgi:hypothetical protein
MFTLQTSFKPLLLNGGGGGGYNLLVKVTVNSKEENSSDFCPNNVQEFGLSALFIYVHMCINWSGHCPFFPDELEIQIVMASNIEME